MAPTFTSWAIKQTDREDYVGQVCKDIALIVTMDSISLKRNALFWVQMFDTDVFDDDSRNALDGAIDEYNMWKYGKYVCAEASGLHMDA